MNKYISPVELDMMRGMVNILNEASETYYNSGTPIMSDAQWDARLRDLKELEESTGCVLSNSPNVNVGATVLSELKEVEHKYPMLSLDKCHTTEEIVKFANNKELVASIKLDGCSVALTYENGTLVKGESRGNGQIGNDITEHVKKFINVPLKINKEDTYLVYGECIINDKNFAEVNKNNEFKNSRNLTSGTLSVLDTSLVAERKLEFIVWDVIEGGCSNSLFDNLCEAKDYGFDIVPNWHITKINSNMKTDAVEWIYDYAKEEGLPCDGVVFKFNDIEYGKSLGATSHHFKNGVAYKKQNIEAETILKDIEWGMGKHGTLTPVAIFESVELCGTTVNRASLHNLSVMYNLWNKSWHSGLTLTVCKANDIIPMVTSVKHEISSCAKRLDPPHICPICGGKTAIKQDNNSKILVCLNDNCKGKLVGKLTHFASKNAMNIDGLSESTLEKFIELGYVNSFADIYELKSRFYDELIKLDGFGKKSVDKLMNAIETSKNTTLDRFIYSLSIPMIGRSASKTIAEYFDYDFKKFTDIFGNVEFDWDELDDFGSAMSDSIWNFINNNGTECFVELPEYLTFNKVNKVSNFNNLSGKAFCITGSLNHFMNRDEVVKTIEAAGGKVSGSVSAKTSYLVNNDINSTSGKNKKAKELGVRIITENELIGMLK